MVDYKIQKIISNINTLTAELKLAQDKCKHLNVTKKYRSDTGNWCKSDDIYWTEFTCPDCFKFWEAKGSV